MLELLFLLSFTLHNIEEGIWLPAWSKYAGKYHPKVSNNEFQFAVLIITIFGYLLTFIFLTFGKSSEIFKYLYLGFVLMMCLNAFFPHLLATFFIRRYAPGTLTGLLLNLPIGLYMIFNQYGTNLEIVKLLAGLIFALIINLVPLRYLFKLGKKLLDDQ